MWIFLLSPIPQVLHIASYTHSKGSGTSFFSFVCFAFSLARTLERGGGKIQTGAIRPRYHVGKNPSSHKNNHPIGPLLMEEAPSRSLTAPPSFFCCRTIFTNEGSVFFVLRHSSSTGHKATGNGNSKVFWASAAESVVVLWQCPILPQRHR